MINTSGFTNIIQLNYGFWFVTEYGSFQVSDSRGPLQLMITSAVSGFEHIETGLLKGN